MRWPIRFALFALLLRAAPAQIQPHVAEILKNVSSTYKAASQYEFVVDAVEHDARTGTDAASHMLFAFKAPDKYRIEGKMPGVRIADANLGDTLIVYDGSSAWFYLPKSNQYGSFPASALTADAPGDLGDMRPEAVDRFLMWRFRGAAGHTDGSKFLREDTIEFGGAMVPCYVIAVSPERRASSYTWWVDKKQYRILREDHAGDSAVFTTIKLDEPLPCELFEFKMPPGARKVETRR